MDLYRRVEPTGDADARGVPVRGARAEVCDSRPKGVTKLAARASSSAMLARGHDGATGITTMAMGRRYRRSPSSPGDWLHQVRAPGQNGQRTAMSSRSLLAPTATSDDSHRRLPAFYLVTLFMTMNGSRRQSGSHRSPVIFRKV